MLELPFSLWHCGIGFDGSDGSLPSLGALSKFFFIFLAKSPEGPKWSTAPWAGGIRVPKRGFHQRGTFVIKNQFICGVRAWARLVLCRVWSVKGKEL